MRIYRYQDRHSNCELPIAEVWLEEDYPNSVDSSGTTLHALEVAHDKKFNLSPRHLPEEERNFVPYIEKVKYNDGSVHEFERIKFEKLYRLHYYETQDLEKFLLENSGIEITSHRGHIFERTWMD